MITYDDNGDYGHPDHIMAHRVATAAAERAADPSYGAGEPWQVAKFYWTATPKSVLRRSFEAIRGQVDLPFGAADVDDLPFGVDDELVTTARRRDRLRRRRRWPRWPRTAPRSPSTGSSSR